MEVCVEKIKSEDGVTCRTGVCILGRFGNLYSTLIKDGQFRVEHAHLLFMCSSAQYAFDEYCRQSNKWNQGKFISIARNK